MKGLNSETVNPRMLTSQQLAEFLQISDRTLRRLVSSGKIISPTRIGRQVRWPLAKILTWIEEGCPAPAKQRKGK